MPRETSARQQFEKQLAVLVDRFAKHHDEYMRANYSETEVRAEFIDPFFEALGWDLQNRAGRSPKTREVFREAGETHGRVDYVFRIDSRDVFYVEAKAPHLPLERVDVVMQAKRYAWNSPNVFISAVTDFEEFRLYDATAKPDRKHPNAGLIFEYRYTDYLKPKALNDLWLLSRELVGTGSIDQLLKKSSVQARQRIPVDQAFLDDLSAWREQLAKAVFRANPELSPADLNSIVQVFLDRLIFIRICEDRRIMDPRQLAEVAENWEHSGKRTSMTNDLNPLFHEVNDRLNGEIFKPGHVEKIDWDINAALIADIIKNLYFPASPYLFDKIPVELLGSIYERYLGKTIRVTETRAVVEDKPEVRKAGGVYYTPKYIVDYIVEQTVGKLIKGKTPKQIEKLRILDPACGSGSFLIGAYQKLLDHHTHYYANQTGKRTTKSQPRLIDESEGGEFKLSLEDKAAILRNNIYGVDIDPQAVEITMMSLYIKMLEDERGILSGRALLPRLRDNIRCGNSLIGYDIGDLSDDERARINPFDWSSKSEGFGEIMETGGFDAVIGNPPWGADFSDQEIAYFRKCYKVAEGLTADSYALFIERALSRLKTKGLLGFITPDTFLRKEDHIPTRVVLFEQTNVKELIESGPLFSKVRDTWCLVFNVEKSKPNSENEVRHRHINRFVVSPEERLQRFSESDWDVDTLVPQSVWMQKRGMVVGYLPSKAAQQLIDKLESNSKLGEMTEQFRISRGEEGSKFALKENPSGNFWMVIPENVERYDVAVGKRISSKTLTRTKLEHLYQLPKIWIIRIQKMRWKQRLVCGLDNRTNSAGMKTLQVVVSTSDNLAELKYLQAILASSLMNFWCVNYLADDMNQTYLEKLPIRTINFADPADESRHNKMVALVEQMLDLHKQKQAAKSDIARERIEREIHVMDEQIDALVYELYGLTKEEIKIVEGQ